ncbi:16S rRNA (guanine(966)-N(2))-methyltransferase RsmD [Entomobacter blattae]|uniref:Ribosomal RNA small subunit methyltransferase D n=1 Tax=Entomobacter blattae TaxID=2762277 RepID=A0A7H1NPM2_9PROT|nr:16S rRNA (guanine(966)-N(2))-methyltransferase RsmD [Entomobacter blattae]QNT77732.1 Ribosomal RNA small subunit methyltransferase D [Entomobacter blattae]
MHIIAGSLKGKKLATPPGPSTRPTAIRVRQALFDMLLHAPWGGNMVLSQAFVLDIFAGTGALGLEALSRGAAYCYFFENDATALPILRSNIRHCRKEAQSTIIPTSALTPPMAKQACSLAFFDPPYNRELIAQSLQALTTQGWILPNSLIVTETSRQEILPFPKESLLAERFHGAACLRIWRFESTWKF